MSDPVSLFVPGDWLKLAVSSAVKDMVGEGPRLSLTEVVPEYEVDTFAPWCDTVSSTDSDTVRPRESDSRIVRDGESVSVGGLWDRVKVPVTVAEADAVPFEADTVPMDFVRE